MTVPWTSMRSNQQDPTELRHEIKLLSEQASVVSCFLSSSVQLLSHVRLYDPMDCCSPPGFSGSITNSQSSLKHMSIELVMQSNHLIFCFPLLLPSSIFPSIRVFSKESVLHNKWPKYWSFHFSISTSNEHSGLIFFRIGWFDLAVQGTRKRLL